MVVLFCDFMDYFRDLSTAIENDDYFQAVTLNAWVLPAQDAPGAGGDDDENRNANNNTASCRALVTHPDGVQEARKARVCLWPCCSRVVCRRKAFTFTSRIIIVFPYFRELIVFGACSRSRPFSGL